MKEEIGTVEFASLLYDFYGSLLGEKQEEIMNLYHEDNLTLSEIADELGMSRQAVHYTLKKAENALEQYEDKLALVEKYKNNEKAAAEALAACDRLSAGGALSEQDLRDIANIRRIIQKLAE